MINIEQMALMMNLAIDEVPGGSSTHSTEKAGLEGSDWNTPAEVDTDEQPDDDDREVE